MRTALRLPACLAAGLSILSALSCGPGSYPSELQLPDGGLIPGTTCSADRTVCWTVTPNAKAATNDGNTPTTVVITLTQGGSPVPDGSQGNFAFQGSTSASFAPIQPGATPTVTVQGETANGQITIMVYDLAVEKVTLTLTASIVYSTSSSTLTSTQVVQFGGTCSDSFITAPTTTSSLSGIAANISLKCNDAVMGGSFSYQQSHPYDGNTQSCTALVADINEQGVVNAAVQYLTEAGAVESDVQVPGQHPTEITNSAGEAAVSFHVQAPYPEDVPYDPTLDQLIEPAATDTWGDTQQPRMWTDSTGHTYNPRDGWVTLMAATAGKPPGGSNTLVPEPYVDSNDNGQWDPGEPYIDVNCNGKYDPVQTPDANGYIRIWTSTTVVWTDIPYPELGDIPDPAAATAGVVSGEILGLESPAKCVNTVLGSGATCNMVFRFVDKNGNLPSAMQTQNLITASATSSGCQLTAATTDPSFDLAYSEHQLALTDFAFSVTNANVTPPTTNATYTYSASGTFNYVDPNDAENAALNLVSPLIYTPTVKGNCLAPGG